MQVVAFLLSLIGVLGLGSAAPTPARSNDGPCSDPGITASATRIQQFQSCTFGVEIERKIRQLGALDARVTITPIPAQSLADDGPANSVVVQAFLPEGHDEAQFGLNAARAAASTMNEPLEHVVISDQDRQVLFDGSAESPGTLD